MLLVAVSAAGVARAYPDGAPWGASNPESDESCSSCHYDFEPVMDSDAIEIDGWPETIVAGKRYTLTVRFTREDAKTAGFQVTAMTGDGDAGVFLCGPEDTEATPEGIRSIAPRSIDGRGLSWTFQWQAPDLVGDVTLLVAASAANDDGSPFGDVIHYRAFRLPGPQ